MSSAGRNQSRRRRGKKPKAVDLWRPVTPLDPPEPIRRASDATAVVRSLGSPPLKGQGVKAEQNLAVAVDKAAELAAEVLALTAGLLPPDEGDEEV